MPQGKGTYGSQVGRPSKKRTSFVNDNSWWDKLTSGIKNLRPYNPQALVQNMKYRESKSVSTTRPRGDGMDDNRSMPSPRPMGEPSNYKARQDRDMFGSTILTMPNTVRRKK